MHTTTQYCKLQSKLSDKNKLFHIKSLTKGSSLTHFGMYYFQNKILSHQSPRNHMLSF